MFMGTLLLATVGSAAAQAVFDAKGFQPQRETFSQLPFEHIDPLTGNLLLTFTDLSLPGNAGLDLNIQRTYNSKIYKNYATLGEALEEDSWAGTGWTLHFGRVFHGQASDTGDPIIEMSDGSRHRAYPHIQPPAGCSNCFITRDFWIYDKATATLTLTSGVRYTFGHPGTVGSTEGLALYTTAITDTFGNTIGVEYQAAPGDALLRVTQNLGNGQSRQVNFTTTATSQASLWTMTYLDRTWTYQQDPVVPTTDTSHSLLTKMTPPVGPAWLFEYSLFTTPRHELTKVTLPAGGTASYTYGDKSFLIGTTSAVLTRVVTQRTTGGRAIPAGTWTFLYAAGQSENQTVITGPSNKITYDFYGIGGYTAVGAAWTVGALYHRTVSEPNGVELERRIYLWTPSPAISTEDENVGQNHADDILVPLVSQVDIYRQGASFNTQHFYQPGTGGPFGNYGRPFMTVETSNTSPSMVRWTDRTFAYGFAGYIVDKVQSESVSFNDGARFTTSSTYNTTNGFRLSQTLYGATTTYLPTTFGDVYERRDANFHATRYAYSWGSESSVETPEYTFTRVINPDGTVASETRRGFTTQFGYDKLRRPTSVTPPFGYGNPTTTTYDNVGGTYVRVERGTAPLRNSVTTNLDGFGRDSGTLDAVGVKTDRQYNASGELTYTSHPYSPNTHSETSYGTTLTYDGLGRLIRRTNPELPTGSFSTLAYNGLEVTITDEESRVTTQTFGAFGEPNAALLTAVTQTDGSSSLHTEYTYNALGRLTAVIPTGGLGGPGTRQWFYNDKDQLAYENQPEQGLTTYLYDAVGNLRYKNTGPGVTEFKYDGNDRLTTIDYPQSADDVTFGYDASDNRTSMSNASTSTTWEFDGANRMTFRRDVIGNRTFKTTYAYDDNDNLKQIDYPSARTVKYTFDAANRIATVTNGTDVPYASAFTYHGSGALAGFTSGNGVAQTFGYDRRLRLQSISSAPLTLTYGHDRVGNVISTTDPRPGFSSSFTVDAFDRLKTVTGFGAASYSYDLLGNRTSKTTALGTVNYTINSSTQQVTSTAGYEAATYQYDIFGNMLSDGATTSTYTGENMVKTATTAGVQTTYTYDPGQLRATKTTDGVTTFFLHGPADRLLSEYEVSSTKPLGWIRDYIYAGDRLISGESCNFGLAATGTTLLGSGGAGAVALTASPGCAWTASSDSPWLTVGPASGVGGAAMNYSAADNTAPATRTGVLTIGGVPFTVVQAGASGCTYALSPPSATYGTGAASGSINVTAPAGCPWSLGSNPGWLTVTSSPSGSANGTVTYAVSENPSLLRNGSITIAGQTFTVTQSGTPAGLSGPRRSDLVAWRPGSGTWSGGASDLANDPAAPLDKHWGNASLGDVPLSADMDGDGISDLVVWRASTGDWYWLASSNGYAYPGNGVQWGSPGDKPFLADIDGDGGADPIVWRPSNGTWYWLTSSTAYSYASAGGVQWGNEGYGDIPLVGDMDGDGRADLAVWRPSGSVSVAASWYWLTSSTGYSYASATGKQWGNQSYGDVPILGDLDGDGKSDLIVWRAPTGTWYGLTSSTQYDYAAGIGKQWGNQAAGDVPLLGDLDADGKAELIVWRASEGRWYWLTSVSGFDYAFQAAKYLGGPVDVANRPISPPIKLLRLTTPVTSPPAGQYFNAVDVVLTSTPGAKIVYTLDGTTPSETSTTYTTPLRLSSATTLRARSYLDGYLPTPVTAAAYTFKVAPPRATPAPGTYIVSGPGFGVVLKRPTLDSTVFFTTDGTDPTQASTQLLGPVSLSLGTTQLKARAFRSGMLASDVFSGQYVVSQPPTPPAAPPFKIEYYHVDATGSVRAVTSAAGAVVARHDFFPFGEEYLPPPVTSDALGFAGKERDPETGLDYFGARYYRATAARFTTVDPVNNLEANLIDPQRWNRYAYVRNNPLRFTDPDGRQTIMAPAGLMSQAAADVRAARDEYNSATGLAAVWAGVKKVWVEANATSIYTPPVMAVEQSGAGILALARSVWRGEAGSVYRGLAQGESIAGGLTARMPGAGNTAISHVAGRAASQWISTTKSMAIAVDRYGQHGVVRIDLSRVTTPIVDVSGGFAGKPGMISNWAIKSQEVLIQNSVPAGAITRIK